MPDDDLMLRNLAILFLAATAAVAQSDRSTLTGLVTDQTGAVIPSAAVEAVNQATGLKYATTSTGSVSYTHLCE